ncbi:putative transporter, putative,major facilitator superfamily protein (MFS) [Trypanosoma conorhini]|uniref:Putative transporter, putative,major facilitator superfamily protein (MFS) n=1 Tax=Trypanosoma conorhini TaxID=83891 RepID=A0A422Q931_9TRYP|nr:putative transporter, putative,major facilitator superfamily protein (MFS) [Trypanosoma conorhini]RNF26449.1 putative transporter, putative,major facilitator superfamily protein (MFS) [Trypanosoma conorhini]
MATVGKKLYEMCPDQTDERAFRRSAKSSRPDGEHAEDAVIVREEEEEERPGCWRRTVTPRVVLAIFTALNFITYYDRGAISGCLASIKEDKQIAGDTATLTDTKMGFIVSGFMVGFMTTSPLFAALGGTVPSKWMIVGGMVAWALACVGTGFAMSYVFLLVCRIIVGVGEAAFVGFTVTTIDRIAPPNSRTLWIGTFYSMMPVGTAVGMAVGGIISSFGAVGFTDGWRLVFFSEVLASVPIVLLIAFLPAIYNMRQDSDEKEYFPLHKATWILLKNLNYVLIVFGYAMYCFVLGSVAVWGIPMLIQGPMQLSYMNASLIMGGVTALTGVLGSVAGGLALDKIGGRDENMNMIKGQLLLALTIAVSVPLGIVALFMKNLGVFIFLLIVSVFALFMVTAPVNAAIMSVVPEELKAYAISYSVFVIHALGDFPSPTFTGLLSDQVFSRGCPRLDYANCVHDSADHCRWVNSTADASSGHCVSEYQLRDALLVVFSIMFLAVPCWLIVCLRMWRSRRRAFSLSEGSRVSLVGEETHQAKETTSVSGA